VRGEGLGFGVQVSRFQRSVADEYLQRLPIIFFKQLRRLPNSRTNPHTSQREGLVFYCRTTSASTAPCTSRSMCCPTHCASYCAPCLPLLRAFFGWIRSPSPTTHQSALVDDRKLVRMRLADVFLSANFFENEPSRSRAAMSCRQSWTSLVG